MATCASKPSEWRKRRSKVSFLLFIYSLRPPLLLFHLSMLLLMHWWDVWLPWFQMFLIAQMPGLACCYTPTCYSIHSCHTNTHACTRKHVRGARAYLRACTRSVQEKCRAVCVRTKQLQLPAREEKLPVASLQTAAGQPRYQPISYVEAECRKLAWLPLGEKLRNIMRQHDKFIWGYERGGEKSSLPLLPLFLSLSTLVLSLFLQLLLS